MSNVNHPAHYNQYEGIEIIDLVEQMNFNRGGAVKYIARAGFKNKATEVEDLEKALWLIKREIKKVKRAKKATAPKPKHAKRGTPPTPTTVSLRPVLIPVSSESDLRSPFLD